MHRHFDEQLRELHGRLILMGGVAESMVGLAVKTLGERNESHCADVFRKEEEVNELEIEVDDRAVKLTALKQPVASDVRFLFTVLRVATDVERIADQAVNICQNVHHLLQHAATSSVDLSEMARIAEQMVHESLEALARRDVALADRVLELERRVDDLKDGSFRALLESMQASPATIPAGVALLLIARNLERIGDHATNIAEEVIYLVQGRDVRHHHEEKTRKLKSKRS